MKKTLKLWMLLVIALCIASCTDNSDEPVVNTTLEEALAKKGRSYYVCRRKAVMA